MKNKWTLSVFFLLTMLAVNTTTASLQVLKTKLQVTVIDGLGNYVEGATVTVYSTAEDYKKSENAVIQSKSDKKGRVLFKELETKLYFLDVRKDQMNNDGEGVQTGPLTKGKINKVNVVIE